MTDKKVKVIGFSQRSKGLFFVVLVVMIAICFFVFEGTVFFAPPPIVFDTLTPGDGEHIPLSQSLHIGVTGPAEDYYSFVEFNPAGVSNSDLFLWARLDTNLTATTTPDESEYGHLLTLMGNPRPKETSGCVDCWNESFDFDGNYIYAGSIFPPTGPYTKAAWVKLETDSSGGHNIVSSTYNVNAGHYFWVDSADSKLSAGHGGITDVQESVSFPLDEWRFVAVVFDPEGDPDSNEGSLTLYNNGVNVGSVGGISIGLGGSPLLSEISIGALGNGASHTWNGTIDEVLLFSRALSQNEIRSLYNSMASEYSEDFPALGDGESYSFTAHGVNRAGEREAEPLSRTVYYDSSASGNLPTVSFNQGTTEGSTSQNHIDILLDSDTDPPGGRHYAFADFNNDLLLWMTMDDIDPSGNPQDWSSYNHHGVNINAVQTDCGGTCYWGDGFNFNPGTSSRIVLPHEDLWNSQSYTRAAWVRLDFCSEVLRAIIVSTMNVADVHHFGVRDELGGFSECKLMVGNGTDKVVYDNVKLSLNTWYFATVTYDSASQTMRLYKNGIEVDNAVGVAPPDSEVEGYIGWGGGGYPQPSSWNGILDDVLIFNRPFSNDEIRSLYDASSTQYSHTFENLDSGEYSFTGHAVGAEGDNVSTGLRTVTLEEFAVNFDEDTSSGSILPSQPLHVGIEGPEERYYSFVEFNNDLLLWARMDEEILSDESGYGRTLNNHGAVREDCPECYGENSFYFNKSNSDYIEVEGDVISEYGSYTKAAWVNLYDLEGVNSIISSEHNLDTGHNFWVASGGYLTAGHGTNVAAVNDPELFQEDVWTFVAVVYDAQGENLTLYKNGNAVSFSSVDITIGSLTPLLSSIFVGSAGIVGFEWNGSIDEVLIFNRSLSGDEIQSLYNASQYQYNHNFTDLGLGSYAFEGHGVNGAGTKASTGLRTVIVQEAGDPFAIGFGEGTTPNGDSVEILSVEINQTNVPLEDYYSFVEFNPAGANNSDLFLWARLDTPTPIDESEYGHILMPMGDSHVTSGCTDCWNESFEFDGNGDYIDLGDIMPHGAYTKAAWVKRNDDPDNNNNIIAGGSGHAFWAPDDYSFKLSSGHNNVYNLVQDPVALSVGVWY
ncbi:MAG: LamG domain-containing protein, partial [archaeon]